jgi:hypothetical protein
MESIAIPKRKLIDIKPGVFEALTVKAKGKSMSLKSYIEHLLEEDVKERPHPVVQGVSDNRILKLIGSAKSVGNNADDIRDERLQYILSK